MTSQFACLREAMSRSMQVTVVHIGYKYFSVDPASISDFVRSVETTTAGRVHERCVCIFESSVIL